MALFAGIGGGILAGIELGWRTRCAVEIDPYARRVLLARQLDGSLPRFPIWDDIRTFDGAPWRGHIDVVSGGFPCQDISKAGTGAGISGERSGLWREMARVIREVGPRLVAVENSADLAYRGMGTILGDLALLGFHAEWGVLSACAVGAPHTRERLFILAHASCVHGSERMGARRGKQGTVPAGSDPALRRDWLESVRRNAGGADGDPNRVDRLRAIGNAQVPAQAAAAFRLLYKRINPC